ncbi:hypothetical protein FSARC_6404 [Fusarium sarcochroum]|uniref:Uncharacterized protein n=1 Tax=Fusarium sarcochroum TaxID=1208366 RepID=A0A8H4X929_9HYPO|nr:hypothetical protein FSARC_6404 [Fusarium sarcochroum]
MYIQLLPASAAAFAPRASVNVVLGSKVEPWLTQTLKRINRVNRPLNSVPQHHKCLTETLSSPNAIWTLASLMLPKTPESDFKRDANNPLVEASMNYDFVHVEAYVVHVDMVLRNEVTYKLTKDTVEALVDFHKKVYCVDAKANTYDWTDKERQCKKLHDDFIQDINKFVFSTHVSALEGLEEGGAGELLCGKSEEVTNEIKALMKPLLLSPSPCGQGARSYVHCPPSTSVSGEQTCLQADVAAVDSETNSFDPQIRCIGQHNRKSTTSTHHNEQFAFWSLPGGMSYGVPL